MMSTHSKRTATGPLQKHTGTRGTPHHVRCGGGGQHITDGKMTQWGMMLQMLGRGLMQQ